MALTMVSTMGCTPCPYPTAAQGTQVGLLGPAPRSPVHQQQPAGSQAYYTGEHRVPMTPTQFNSAFHTMHLRPPKNSWYMDTGSTSHLTNDAGTLYPFSPLSKQHSILVGNDTNIPSLGQGSTKLSFPNRSYYLRNIFHFPKIIKNIVSVRQFTRDNLVSVKFNPFGFFCEGFYTKKILTRHNSTDDLYPFSSNTTKSSS